MPPLKLDNPQVQIDDINARLAGYEAHLARLRNDQLEENFLPDGGQVHVGPSPQHLGVQPNYTTPGVGYLPQPSFTEAALKEEIQRVEGKITKLRAERDELSK